MITEGQILNMCDELEKRVQARDPDKTVKVQARMSLNEPTYIVTIEDATTQDVYEVDSQTHQWFRVLPVDGQ